MINDQIDRYLNQSGIPQSLRPSLRDFARLVADIARRDERRAIVTRLATCPKGTLVADVSLSLAHGLTPCAQSSDRVAAVNGADVVRSGAES